MFTAIGTLPWRCWRRANNSNNNKQRKKRLLQERRRKRRRRKEGRKALRKSEEKKEKDEGKKIKDEEEDEIEKVDAATLVANMKKVPLIERDSERRRRSKLSRVEKADKGRRTAATEEASAALVQVSRRDETQTFRSMGSTSGYEIRRNRFTWRLQQRTARRRGIRLAHKCKLMKNGRKIVELSGVEIPRLTRLFTFHASRRTYNGGASPVPRLR